MSRPTVHRPRLASVAVLLLAAVVGIPSASAASPAPRHPTRTRVPLELDGTNAYVYLRVGGGPRVKVVIDTGAAGLTIARDVIGPRGTVTSEPYVVHYVTSTVSGKIANASVRLVGGTEELVTPKVRVAAVPRSQLLSKWTKGGAVGSLGIAVTVPPGAKRHSPLLDLPAPYSQGLAINYDARYLLVGRPEVHPATVQLPLHRERWRAPDGGPAYAKAVDLCWRIGTKRACAPTVPDTGGVDGIVSRKVLPGVPTRPADRVAPGQPLRISSPSGRVLLAYETSAQRSPSYLADVLHMNTGRGFFQANLVGWDLVAGRMYVTPLS